MTRHDIVGSEVTDMPETPRSTFRLTRATLRKIDHIAKAHGGLTRTRVIELAVHELHSKLCSKPAKPKDLPGQRRMFK
jgi:hypothetical protein